MSEPMVISRCHLCRKSGQGEYFLTETCSCGSGHSFCRPCLYRMFLDLAGVCPDSAVVAEALMGGDPGAVPAELLPEWLR